ncbi:hypothetical protein BK653_27885 [Pseudomonas brassicacearum]|uniref:hypothetical protein n=1 Tax=Pseudomonas brassicacearum TaxID=930166 RepID=UPI000F4975AB|nr:hypothetical protein [Pseudomonas brassicacearum]ROM62838.1 hypothetical protein BK653_27885 [Pseudomonas brassicacearum]
MATRELRLSMAEVDTSNKSPEVVVEFYLDDVLQFATFVSSSVKNGAYDTVNVKTDADDDGDMDKQDETILLELASAFSRFK